MSGKPPRRPPSEREIYESELKALTSLWEQEDAACDRALEKDTKEGDKEAEDHYNACIALTKEKERVRAKLNELDTKSEQVQSAVSAAKKGDFGPIQALPGIRRGGRKTRRRKQTRRRRNKSRR